MSRAFTTESDNEDDDLVQAPVLPPGVRNYITPAGLEALKTEHEQLLAEKVTLGEETFENKHRLRVIQRRLEFLTSRLNAAHVIDPAKQNPDQVLFGARVTVRPSKATDQTWRIVGIDETDLDKGWISWMSPLACTLAEKKIGDIISFGDQTLTILRITYE